MSCGVLDCMPNNATSREADEGSSSGARDAEPVANGVESVGSGGLTQIRVKSHGIPSSSNPQDYYASDGETVSRTYGNPIFPLWTKFTIMFRSMITDFTVMLAVSAARNPKTHILVVTLISFGLMAAGLFTNFNVNTDEQVIYAPFKSRSKIHDQWIKNDSDFPGNSRVFTLAMHAGGDNILGPDYIRKVFQAVDTVRAVPGYEEVCAAGDFINYDGIHTCKIVSVTRFFNDDSDAFEEAYAEGGDDGVTEIISADAYDNLTPVDRGFILGNNVIDERGLISFVQSYNVFFFLANADEGGIDELERLVIDRMAALREEWANDDSPLKLEFFAKRSYSDEFGRAIQSDLFLLPVVFLLMSGFTCMVFFRCDAVHSRATLGVGSVVTILLALMSGFGLMFCTGVPFTSLSQIIPFVIFGVGLDDTFIITGAYFRTDPDKDPVERIREVMQEVGLCISVTTLTTTVAFILGCISSIPAIKWLNMYAIPTILMDFVFQLTFFVGLMVLDERRIQSRRMDCCICIKAKPEPEDWEVGVVPRVPKSQRMPKKRVHERFMVWYARQLMRPWVKFLVVVGFLAYSGFCCYTTTLLRQEFDFSDLLPEESYVKDFLFSIKSYTQRVLGVGIYFRDVDQLDPEVQQQMKNYVDELSALPQLIDETPFCWFRDLEDFKDTSFAKGAGIENMTMSEQLDFAFSIPAIQETYGRHVVRNESGAITASRCFTYVNGVDLAVVKDQIQALQAIKTVTARQPLNQGKKNWSFFTFDQIFFIWEFYTVAVSELIGTTVSGVVAVCGMSVLFFPHWTAMLFCFPLVVMMYICLLGTLQWAGMHINAVTYVCLVISIGLMVDFILHVLLRYYESSERTRDAKVKDTLETLGASILVGGLSTALGVLPLAFSTSSIMGTVFISFFVLIASGLAYGLVFLPVVLSLIGPTRVGHSDPLAGTDDLALKNKANSETDDSDDDSDKAVLQQQQMKMQPSSLAIVDKQLITIQSVDIAPSESGPSHHEVLHSTTTYRDESLEVVQWSETMAWI